MPGGRRSAQAGKYHQSALARALAPPTMLPLAPVAQLVAIE